MSAAARIRPRPCRPSPGKALSFGDPSRRSAIGPVAPGAQVRVLAGPRHRVGGVAALLVLDGRIHLLTCGHLFLGAAAEVTCADAAAPIAELRRNYMDGRAPLDVAVCELTAEGRRLLARSIASPTWLRGYCDPTPDLVRWPADFWPSHTSGAAARVLSVSAHATGTAVLFPEGPSDGFVECEGAVVPGDSGSLLSVDDLYFGICSGEVQGTWSYFTPFSAALDRVCAEHQVVSIWHPDAGIRA